MQDNLVHLSAVESMSLGRPWRDHEATESRAREERHRALQRARGRLPPRLVGRRGAGRIPRAHHRAHREAPRSRRSRLRGRLVDAGGPRAPCATCCRSGSSTRGSTSRTCGGRWDARATSARESAALHPEYYRSRLMPFVIGKKVAPPDGSTVVFSITGHLPRELVLLVLERRAALFDDIPPDPSVRLTMSWVTFERLACGGALDPALCVAANEVQMEGGDADLWAGACGRRDELHVLKGVFYRKSHGVGDERGEGERRGGPSCSSCTATEPMNVTSAACCRISIPRASSSP